MNETTALGAALLVGLAVGFWEDESQLEKCRETDAIFRLNLNSEQRAKLLSGWREAIRKVMHRD